MPLIFVAYICTVELHSIFYVFEQHSELPATCSLCCLCQRWCENIDAQCQQRGCMPAAAARALFIRTYIVLLIGSLLYILLRPTMRRVATRSAFSTIIEFITWFTSSCVFERHSPGMRWSFLAPPFTGVGGVTGVRISRAREKDFKKYTKKSRESNCASTPLRPRVAVLLRCIWCVLTEYCIDEVSNGANV